MTQIDKTATDLVNQQNKVRGLAGKWRTHRFVKGAQASTSLRFRQDLRNLLLDARVALHPLHFDHFFDWSSEFLIKQIPELAKIPIGYEQLSGVYEKAPVATLERELRWVTSHIRSVATTLNQFLDSVSVIEDLVFAERFEEAILTLQQIDEIFGVSFWSVQLRIAFEYHAGGLERQKQYSAKTRGIYRRGLLPFVTHYTSARNEDRITLTKYIEDVRSRIERHSKYANATKTYVRYRLLAELPKSESGLAEVLRVEQSHSILDIYDTYIQVAQEIVRRTGFDSIKAILETSLRCLTSLRDFRVQKCLVALGGNRAEIRAHDRDTGVSDLLLAGQVKKALFASRHKMRVRASGDPWRHVYAGLAWGHANRAPSRKLGGVADVARLIGEIACRREGVADPYSELTKLLANIHGLPSAAGILAALGSLVPDRPDANWNPWLVGINSSTNGIEDYALLDRPLNAPQLTERELSYTELSWSESNKPTEGRVDQSIVHDLFAAAGLLHRHEYEAASEILNKHKSFSSSEPLRVLLASLQLHAFYSLGNRQQVISLIADEGVRGTSYRRLLPIAASMELIEWSDFKRVTSPLAASVALHLLWTAKENDSTAAILRFSIGHFLRLEHIRLPSKIIDHAEQYPLKHLVYFLRFVCVPQFLDVSRLLKSTREVLTERQDICAALRLLDPDNAEEYQDEITAIANQLAVTEGTWIVDRTRIYVDVDAFSRWTAKELAESFARYKDLLGVDVESPQNFDEMLRDILSSAPATPTAFKAEGDADALLVDIVQRMSEEFLTNSSFGLDFYLSKRIRHQSFIGLVRGPLEFSHLITTRESEAGAYRQNTYWLERFSKSPPDTMRAIDSAFSRFASKVDEALVGAKDKYFQIRSADHPSGLFSLDLTHTAYALIRAVSHLNITVEAFTQTVATIFWAALELSLDRIKHFILEDLKTAIIESVDEMRAVIRRHTELLPEFLEFDGQLGRASAEVQVALDQVAAWFTLATLEAQQHQFRLDQIVKIATQSALKSYRSFEPRITTDVVRGDLQVMGTTLVFVNDVVFVALGNVRDHSGLTSPQVHFSIVPDELDQSLTIVVRSDVKHHGRAAAEKNLTALRELIVEKNVGRRTRAEGGSGFLKLAADIQRSSKGAIEFGFSGDEEFVLKVVYSLIVPPTTLPSS